MLLIHFLGLGWQLFIVDIGGLHIHIEKQINVHTYKKRKEEHIIIFLTKNTLYTKLHIRVLLLNKQLLLYSYLHDGFDVVIGFDCGDEPRTNIEFGIGRSST